MRALAGAAGHASARVERSAWAWAAASELPQAAPRDATRPGVACGPAAIGHAHGCARAAAAPTPHPEPLPKPKPKPSLGLSLSLSLSLSLKPKPKPEPEPEPEPEPTPYPSSGELAVPLLSLLSPTQRLSSTISRDFPRSPAGSTSADADRGAERGGAPQGVQVPLSPPSETEASPTEQLLALAKRGVYGAARLFQAASVRLRARATARGGVRVPARLGTADASNPSPTTSPVLSRALTLAGASVHPNRHRNPKQAPPTPRAAQGCTVQLGLVCGHPARKWLYPQAGRDDGRPRQRQRHTVLHATATAQGAPPDPGQRPQPFEATSQPSSGPPKAADLRPDPPTGTLCAMARANGTARRLGSGLGLGLGLP